MKQKKTSYPLAILLSVAALAAPITSAVGFAAALLGYIPHTFIDEFGNKQTVKEGFTSIPLLILTIILFLVFLFTRKPLQNMYQKAIEDNEYDEFGVSKKKSYQNLTRKEREQMDLQKLADMERLVSSSVLKKIVKPGSDHPDEELKQLIGIEPVKQKCEEMVARMRFEQATKKDKKKKGLTVNKNSMGGRHMCFYGSPGTGKTTVARILTGFLFQYGYIKKNKCVEIDGNFLKAGAESAVKTKYIIQQAFDGVLFIDEAYAIVEGTGEYGREVIATLIKEMEDNRDRFILILAGYKEDMRRLVDTNEGFKSRIKEYLEFTDYSVPEMCQMFTLMSKQQGFVVTKSAMENFAERVRAEKMLSSFGNGRTVRNVLDESIDKHALNYGSGKLQKCGENGIEEKDAAPVDNTYRLCGIDVSREPNKAVL